MALIIFLMVYPDRTFVNGGLRCIYAQREQDLRSNMDLKLTIPQTVTRTRI